MSEQSPTSSVSSLSPQQGESSSSLLSSSTPPSTPPSTPASEAATDVTTPEAATTVQAQQPVDLKAILLPEDWTLEQLEAEARRIYDELVKNPPVTPSFPWLEKRTLIVADSEGGFRKIFGETTGWAAYQHQKTGELDRERLRRAPWIRPILEMRVPKTKIYVNNHSMKPREFGSNQRQEKKRVFITLSKDVIFFISLVYTQHGLALGTAFAPDGQWLREMQKKSMLLGPM